MLHVNVRDDAEWTLRALCFHDRAEIKGSERLEDATMKIRNLMTIGMLVAGCATLGQAQTVYGPGHNDPRFTGRDLGMRGEAVRRVEADRRQVEHERVDLRYANRYVAARDSRELRAAEARLQCDRLALERRPGRW
jgi:hypothetical protein